MKKRKLRRKLRKIMARLDAQAEIISDDFDRLEKHETELDDLNASRVRVANRAERAITLIDQLDVRLGTVERVVSEMQRDRRDAKLELRMNVIEQHARDVNEWRKGKL